MKLLHLAATPSVNENLNLALGKMLYNNRVNIVSIRHYILCSASGSTIKESLLPVSRTAPRTQVGWRDAVS